MATKTVKTQAITPDAILAPYDPPAQYVAHVTDSMSVAELRQEGERLATSYEAGTRRFVRDTVTVWSGIGRIVDRIGRLHGGDNGTPLADGAVPTWAQVKRALHHSPDIAKRSDGKGGQEATIAGWSERMLSQCWDAYRSGAGERANRWLQLCEDRDVVATAPKMFKPNDAKTLIAWSLADSAIPKRTDDAGKVIAAGSNRAGTGKNVETDRLTVAEMEAERKADNEAAHGRRVDILTGDPKTILVQTKTGGKVTVAHLVNLSDEGLKMLASFIASEQRRRKDTPEAPVVQPVPPVLETTGRQQAALKTGEKVAS